jgi:hypothetical protein
MSRRLGRVRLVLTIILVPLSVLVAGAYWFSEGHGAPLASWSRIGPGMTRDQVIALLGRPGTIHRSADGSETWYYTRGTFCMVEVKLATGGLVSETVHDH